MSAAQQPTPQPPPDDGTTDDGPQRRGARRQKKPRRGKTATASAGAPPAGSGPKIKDEVALCVSLVATGRTPLDGWILSLGAVAVATETRRVLGTFTCNCLPLLPSTHVEPARDVVGYLRKQRAELELFYRRGTRLSAAAAMEALRSFCAPYANLTLVGSPLFSIYGWLSFYWAHAFPAAAMPWGFSTLCARSYAAGALGVAPRKLAAAAGYRASFEGYRAIGIPVGDALAVAVSHTHLSWRAGEAGEAEGADGPPPVTFACPVPALLAEAGAVPASAAATAGPIRWSPSLPGDGAAAPAVAAEGSGAESAEAAPFPPERPLLECVVDKEVVLDGIAAAASAVAADFTVYPSITDCAYYRNFVQQLPDSLRGASTEWVATEKVHGSNITIFCDGQRLWAGKRTSLLTLDDSGRFFDYVFLIEENRTAFMAAYHLVCEWVRSEAPAEVRPFLPTCPPPPPPPPATAAAAGGTPLIAARDDGGAGVVVAFLCELAGGVYPHPAVPADLRGVRVQNGVYYSPRNFLYGFDIAVTGAAPVEEVVHALHRQQKDDGSGGGAGVDVVLPVGADGRYYLPFDVATHIFAESGMEAYAQPLHRGTLSDLLALPVEFVSSVATEQLGLPPLTACVNAAEGYVVRPAQDAWVRAGTDSGVGWARVMLKRKHPRFDEFAVAHSATSPGQLEQAATEGVGVAVEERGGAAAVDLRPFLTAGRVQSVLSKYTEDEQADQPRMVAAVLADAMADAERAAGGRNPSKLS